MPMQMTKTEYEKKYGIKPVFSVASTLDTTPAPVRMTQAEYDKKYGIKVKENKNIFTPAKEAITEFPDVYKQGAKDISSEIKQSAEDIGKMDFTKPGLEQLKIAGRLAKTGARVAGDFAGVVFAPIGAAIQATGFNKLTDYLANKIVESPIGQAITDMPTVQKFAVTHPNAEKDFNRAIMLLMTKGEKGKIEPKTAVSRTVEQVKGGVETIKSIPAKIETYRSTKVTEKVAKEISNIEKNYVQTRKANEFTKDAGTESRQRIAQTDVLVDAVDKDGLIRTKQPGGAVEQYRKLTIDGAESVVKDNLVREGKKINLGEVATELTAQVYRSGLEGADLIKAVNGLRSELAGLKLRADELGNIELAKIHDAKISTTNNINYKTDSTPTIKFRKAKARAYKTLVENRSDIAVEVNGKKYGVPEINGELGKYYSDIERLQMLDGKRVKGGKLGKYTAQIAGNVAGAAVGGMFGGFGGSAVGTVIGGETAGFLKGKSMASTFGEAKGRDVLTNAILEKAKAEGKLPPAVNLKISDVKIGTPKGIIKTKEIFKVENDIARNVEQQKTAIKAGNFELVAVLKEIYQVLVQHLKDLVKNNQKEVANTEKATISNKSKLIKPQVKFPYSEPTTNTNKSQAPAEEIKSPTKILQTKDKILSKPNYNDIRFSEWDTNMTDQYTNWKNTVNNYFNPAVKDRLLNGDGETFKKELKNYGFTGKEIDELFYSQKMNGSKMFDKFLERYYIEKQPLTEDIISQQQAEYYAKQYEKELSGFDVNEIDFSNPVDNAKIDKAIENQNQIIKNIEEQPAPLAQEARPQDFATAEEFVRDRVSGTKLINKTSNEPITFYRGERNRGTEIREHDTDAMYGRGIYFTTEKNTAESYAKVGGGEVSEVYLNMKNPLTPNSKLWYKFIQEGSPQDKTNFLIRHGFDGVSDITKGKKVMSQVMVLKPEQIITKSQLTDIWNKANKK